MNLFRAVSERMQSEFSEKISEKDGPEGWVATLERLRVAEKMLSDDLKGGAHARRSDAEQCYLAAVQAARVGLERFAASIGHAV
jgi:hypothetical protein